METHCMSARFAFPRWFSGRLGGFALRVQVVTNVVGNTYHRIAQGIMPVVPFL